MVIWGELRGWRKEAGGALEGGGECGPGGVDGGAPGGGIFAAGHLLEGLRGEVGIAEVVGAIHIGAAEGLGDEVDLGGGAVWGCGSGGTQLREVIGGEDVEDLDQNDAARGGWRGGDYVVTVVVTDDGSAIFDLVGGEIGGGDEATVLLHFSGDGGRDRPGVEVGGVGGDAAEGFGEDGLGEAVAGLVEVAVALEDVGGGGEVGEGLVFEVGGFGCGEYVTVRGQFDGGGHVFCESEFAEVGVGEGEAGDGARDAGGEVALGGAAGGDVAGGVEVHVAGGGGGGFFAVVEEVWFAVMVADEHEAAAAEVAGLRVDDGEGEGHGDGGVDGVAALLEDLDAGVGGVVLDGDDHGVAGGDGEVGWKLGGCGEGGEESDRGAGARGQGRAPGGRGVVRIQDGVGMGLVFASLRSVVKGEMRGFLGFASE